MNYLDLLDTREEYQALYDRSQMYCARIWSEQGKEGVLKFLEGLLVRLPLIARALKKNYRIYMTAEESAALNAVYEEVLESGREENDPARLAELTLAALYTFEKQAPRIVRRSAGLARRDDTFLEAYDRRIAQLVKLPFYPRSNIVQLLRFKYHSYDTAHRYDDIYLLAKQLPLLTDIRRPEPLVKLFHEVLANRDFKYLWVLSRMFPTATLEKLQISQEELAAAGRELSEPFTHYVCFCDEMVKRSHREEAEQMRELEGFYPKLKESLMISHPETVALVDVLRLCNGICLLPEKRAELLSETAPGKVSGYELQDGYVMKQQEKAFRSLIASSPELVLSFIRTLGENNLFAFSEKRDYRYAESVSYITAAHWTLALKQHYSEEECVGIYMNSILRSIYPLTSFLRELLLERRTPEHPADENSDPVFYTKVIKKLFRPYVCFGKFVYNTEENSTEIVSYSFRNDQTRTLYNGKDIAGSELGREVRELVRTKKSTKKGARTIAFRLEKIDFMNDLYDHNVLRAKVLPEYPDTGSFRTTRRYFGYGELPSRDDD